ncbi:MAG: iron ABC transporter permease [Armatimonadota bacterium]|nr:iron ABC transporter permease [Armatimonadota bacterium]MDR7520014.1 iron ABC transporter permease [Armatimonadota bacterium]MDR7549223.1 iron ABC transporter permease [Armatimonadota bacterium]
MTPPAVEAAAPPVAPARVRVPGIVWAVPLYAFLVLFILFPLWRLFADAVTTEDGVLTLGYLADFATDPFYRRTLVNSLIVASGTVVGCVVIGFLAAFLLVRYDFPGRATFGYLTMLPIIMPPLVGIMGLVFVLGRAGTVNVILMDYLGVARPVNFIYGWHGVLLAMILHYFPLITLNVVDGLSKLDASLEEAAEAMGSRGLRKIRDIVVPLVTPGFVSGATLVFILAFADFATPLVVGLQNLIASQAYLNIVQFVDRRLFKMGIVIGALMALMAIAFLLVARRIVAMREYAVVSYRGVERRPLRGIAAVLAPAFFVAILTLAFLPYLGVTLAAFGRAWSLTPFPTRFTLGHLDTVLHLTPIYVVNTLRWSGLAVLIILLVGVPLGWILARTSLPGRGLADAVVTLVLALPGTAIGIAYIRAFHFPLPPFGLILSRLWIIMPLVLAVRRMPYTVRATFASLLSLHRSMEESAASVGASGLRTFFDITLPLIWRGVLAGALFSLMFALQEAAATILLVLPGWETMTVGIFTFYTSGTIGQAAALGFVLILLCAATLYAVYRLTGARMGGFFGSGGG